MKKFYLIVTSDDDNIDPFYYMQEVASKLEDEYGVGGPPYMVEISIP